MINILEIRLESYILRLIIYLVRQVLDFHIDSLKIIKLHNKIIE